MIYTRYNKVDTRFGGNHKYKAGMVGLWDIGEYTGTCGDLVLGKIKNQLPSAGYIIPRYQIEVLSDGLYKGRIMAVNEKNVIEEIDPTPYLQLDANKPKTDEPSISTPVEKPNPFTCDIDELKMDISDLRTDLDSLSESEYQYKLEEGDILVANHHEIELSLADNGSLPIEKEVERAIEDHTSEVTSKINVLHDEIDKTSKVAKLALLSKLVSI